MSIRICNNLSRGVADGLYVNITGDTMTGHLTMGDNKIYFGPSSYIYKNGNTFELWVNGVKRQEWTTTPPPTSFGGIPMGLLVSITYPE